VKFVAAALKVMPKCNRRMAPPWATGRPDRVPTVRRRNPASICREPGGYTGSCHAFEKTSV
jgi:hypothetical protein